MKRGITGWSSASPKRGGAGAADGAMKLRALNAPEPARVQADRSGAPVWVVQGRRRLRVEAVRETWRIDDEWWRRTVSRVYHMVVLEDGRSLTVYQDLTSGGWFEQG